VSACATCDGFFFKDKVVGVVGGGDTALEEALTLTKFAKKVYLIHRRNEFRASKIIQKRVFENKKIEVIWNSEVEEIVGEQKVEAIKVKSQKSKVKNTSQNLKVDGVFIAIGHKPDTDLFKGQVEMDNHGYILTSNIIGLLNLNIENSMKIENCKLKIPKFDMNFTSQTSVPGVFAAGDCADPHYRQVATAVGMGVAAALEVEHWLEQA
jgi:thioredoxin reductase (NADPH)